jgi:hypothetical protein
MACARKWLVTAGLLVAVLLTGPVAAQPHFEIVERGSIDPTVIHAVREATLYSLASLARLGVILTQLRIPTSIDHPFRCIPTTRSEGNRPPIPRESDHGFRGIATG